MKELVLVHPLPPISRTRGGPVSALRESATQNWERLSNGDYLVRIDGDPENEFVVPSAGVKYEKRTRTQAAQKKAG